MAENNDSSSIQHKTLNDNPIVETDTENALYGMFTQRIVNEVTESAPPKTIAITGDWGSGKTSALASVYKQLTNKEPPFTFEKKINKPTSKNVGIWFEAWRYQNEPQPVIALLHAIRREFGQFSKLKSSGKKIFNTSAIGSLTLIDSVIESISGVKTKLADIPKLGETFERENFLSALPSDKFHIALQEAIAELLPNKPDAKLLVFIDDLDRCQPQVALKLLEGIKLYLNIPKCVIIMAIDQAQLESAVKAEISNAPSHQFIGVEYLEKLCQDAHRLPQISPATSAEFVKNQLKAILKPTPPLEISLQIDEIENQLKIHHCLPANPRRIKMVINRLAAYLRCINFNDTAFQDTPLVAQSLLFLTCLQVSYRGLYEQLSWNIEFFDGLVEFADSDKTISEEELLHTPLEGIYQPKSSKILGQEHHSHLRILRPLCIISHLVTHQAEKQDNFKVLLDKLIRSYNA